MGAPKPKLCTQLVEVVRVPPVWPIVIAPTLLERARICAAVSISSGCSVSSWIVFSATWIWSGTLKVEFGVIRPCLERAGDRHDLERRARFVVEADAAVLDALPAADALGSLALTCGQFASARIAPLRGSITIAVAFFG